MRSKKPGIYMRHWKILKINIPEGDRAMADRKAKLLRNTTWMLILLAFGLLLVTSLDMTRDATMLDRTLRILAALALVLGMIPGMYLHRMVEFVMKRSTRASDPGVYFFSIGAPIIGLAIGLFFMSSDLRSIQQARSFGMEPSSLIWNLILDVFLAGLMAAVLAVNARVMLRSN
jgi:hypothetical protein